MHLVLKGTHNVQITNCDQAFLEKIRDKFSYPNEMYGILKRKGNRWVKPRIYSITPTGRYKIGLTNDIIDYVKQIAPTCNVTLDAELSKKIKPTLPFTVDATLLNKTPKDYQLDALDAFMSNGRGVFWMGTGAGKTFSIALALENIKRQSTKKLKCLFLVPDTGLVSQAFDDFKDYGVTFTFSKFTGNHSLDLTSDVIITNRQILVSKKTDASFIADMDYIIIDEVHLFSNKDAVIFELLTDLVKTSNIFGLTGTIPDDMEKNHTLIGLIGNIIFTKRGSELRTEGHISPVAIKCLKLKYKDKPSYVFKEDDPASMYRAELEFLATYEPRNKLICNLIKGYTKNSLILVDTIEHGQVLYDMLKSMGKHVYYIHGGVEVETRDEIKRLLETHNDICVIAITSIFAKGMSINNLHLILMADLSKSMTTIVQAIGRALRKHHSKLIATFIDLWDQHLKYSNEFINDRLKIYEDECINVQIKEVAL